MSGPIPRRAAVVGLVLAVVTAAVTVVNLGVGELWISPSRILAAVVGADDPMVRTVVGAWRTPIALGAVLFGALLGLGGAIFQSLTRNPLGSPDIVGFDVGSYTGVVITMLVFGRSGYWVLAAASLLGGLLTALVVYALAWRGGVQGFRLIIVGIGVSALLGSVNSYLVTRADIDEAMQVGMWSAGSILRVTWGNLVPAAIIAVVVIAAAAVQARAADLLELGDETAATLGVRVQAARGALVVTGVASTALVTAAAGPIGFIALAAPQVGRRLAHTAGPGLAISALMGAALLAAAHCLSLILTALVRPVPVGLVTVCVGGGYLIYVLMHRTSRSLS